MKQSTPRKCNGSISADQPTDQTRDGHSATGHNSHASPVLLRLADVTPEPVRWLWPGNISCGKLTLIAGDPGLGKSILTMDLAARVSTGWKWPDGEPVGAAGGVVLLSAEDDPADTIRPRLDAAGADVERITLLQSVKRTDPESGKTYERTFSLTDLPALDAAIRQTPGCRLVVCDPITAYLGGTDSHKNAEIRGLLAPLSELAQRTGVALVAVTHLNKSSGSPAIYRTMGSLAFAAAARAVWAVTRHPDDPSGKGRLLIPVKNNIGNDQRGFCYVIENDSHGRPVLAWDANPVRITADEALAPARPQGGDKSRPSPALTEAVEWLAAALANGPRTAQELKAAAEGDGIAMRTLLRAKSALNVTASRDGFGDDGGWRWSLPTEPADVETVPF